MERGKRDRFGHRQRKEKRRDGKRVGIYFKESIKLNTTGSDNHYKCMISPNILYTWITYAQRTAARSVVLQNQVKRLGL